MHPLTVPKTNLTHSTQFFRRAHWQGKQGAIGKALRGMTPQDPCLFFVKATVPMSLHPSRLVDGECVQKGVNEQLNAYLLKYNTTLGGVVLSYDKVDVVEQGHGSDQTLGMIQWCYPYVSCKFLLLSLYARCSADAHDSCTIS